MLKVLLYADLLCPEQKREPCYFMFFRINVAIVVRTDFINASYSVCLNDNYVSILFRNYSMWGDLGQIVSKVFFFFLIKVTRIHKNKINTLQKNN